MTRPARLCPHETGGFEVELVRKRIRNIYLRVLPPLGTVRVSAPPHVDGETLRRFVLSRADWIRRRQADVRARAERDENTAPDFFADGEVPLWGRARPLRVTHGPGRPRVRLLEDGVELRAREGDGPALRARLYDAFLREEMRREVERLLALWCPRLELAAPHCALRRMKTRWGSCSPATRRIRLNLRLAEKTPACLEYVLVHELTHFFERGHGEPFRRRMDALLPAWRKLRASLA